MKRLWIAFAAVLIAASAYTAQPASAGVRIGFGFPLGSFTARPSHGPSYNRGHRRSREAGSHYRKKRAVAAGRASQRSKVARMREMREAQRSRAAAARTNAASKTAARTREKNRETNKDDKDDNDETVTTSEPTPLAPAPIAVPGAAPVATAVEPGLVQTTGTLGAPAPVKVQDTGAVATAVEPGMVKTTASTDASEPAASPGSKSKKADCKKFVPAVGLTISVPCE